MGSSTFEPFVQSKGADLDDSVPHLQPVVQELKDKIHYEGWTQLFEDAIRCAREDDLPQVRRIVSLQTYLADINEWLFWIPREDAGGEACYGRIATFYHVLNQAPLKCLQSGCSRDDFEQPLTWLSQWLQRYASAMGGFLDSPESISAESIRTFRRSPTWHLEDYVEPEDGWETYNSFFARSSKLSLRPIDHPLDSAVIVSPADCRLEGCMRIYEPSTVTTKHIEWKVERLLGQSEYKARFKGGVFIHASLAPNNYHRFHAPLAGKVLEATVIPGQVALKLVIKRDKSGAAFLDFREAMDAPGFQAAQARGIMILETAVGLVTIAAIGMAQVSSVQMTIQKGQELQKGEEMGRFQYGGSDIVLMFEARSNMELDAQIGDHLKMGVRIARADMNRV